MARSDDPLACFLYLLARNGLPWGAVEKLLYAALSDVTPPLPDDDPLAVWARAEAGRLRQSS